MRMAEDTHEFEGLGSFFEAAKRDGGRLPEGLSDRILADAAREQALIIHSVERSSGLRKWFGQFRDVLGGWYGMGGLAAACAAGVWIGISPPTGLPDPVQLVFGTQTEMDLLSSDDLTSVLALVEEG